MLQTPKIPLLIQLWYEYWLDSRRTSTKQRADLREIGLDGDDKSLSISDEGQE